VGTIGVLDPQNGPLTAIGLGIGLLVYWLWIPATSIALMRRPEAAEHLSAAAPAGSVAAGAR
jgi:hypothetical protein